ncbi:ARM repeat superfamily protein [Salix suchowensis]|nr:ARM repeat superfamily protein [Salix suchowensis]
MENQQEEEELIRKLDSTESMISVTIGRAITTLLSSELRSFKTPFLASLSPLTTKNLLSVLLQQSITCSLEDSLWFLHKYVKDAIERHEKLDLILIPIIQHCLRNVNLKHGGQAMIIINWLFQDEFVFEAVAMDLANIIERKEDRYVALGWCILVRGLLEYENFMEQYTLNGIRDNYYALLKMLCSCIPRLVCIVHKGSTLQGGLELPSRLSVSAADCILSMTEALTKKTKVASNKPKPSTSNTSHAISLVSTGIKEKKVKPSESSEGFNIEMAYLLWKHIEALITLLQSLLAWSRKSRPLHAKGVEQVLKWLQEIKRHHCHIENEQTGGNILKTEALLVSSCWKHYSTLLHLEDHRFSQHCDDLLNQYISGIQYYTDNHSEGHTENKDGGLETRKFFLRCLCLLLGRLHIKKFETALSDNGLQISQILLSQLHCDDEDVMEGAVYIIKSVILKPNHSSGNGLTDSREMDAVLPLLLHLLDERDVTARAVVMLIAECCSMSTDSNCLKQVLRRLASGNALQRRNAIDVISGLVSISSNSENKNSHLAWQDIANNLLECLNDEETIIRELASNSLSMIEPSFVLPTFVQLVCSSAGKQSYVSASFIAMLKYHSSRPEVICLLLDCLSNLNKSPDPSKTAGDVREESKVDIDQVLKLIPEWSKTVQDWNPLIGPLIDKMFSEPANATIVRFLSYISEQLAEVTSEIFHPVLLQMKGQKEIDEGFLSMWESRMSTDEDSVKMQESLFERLCPLLIIRILPLRVFNDLNSSVLYGQLPSQSIAHVSECGDVTITDECLAALLLKRAFDKYEFEDVRKLAAELCGRIHPQVLLPVVSSVLEHAAASHDVLKIKACLFSVCTSLVVRGLDSISHPAILKIRKMLESILLWPSLDGDEVSKAQHGCIDCLALMICAKLQVPRNAVSGNCALLYVITLLINDENAPVSASMLGSENSALEAPTILSFRVCMANVLISACQKISDSGKKTFAKKTVPRLIQAVEGIMHPDIRAACIQVLFSAVYHLKSAVLPYSSDLLNLSLKFLSRGSEKERMASAKLIASLMASEDVIVKSISGGLLEARSVLSSVSFSDSSHELQQICQKLLACITSP